MAICNCPPPTALTAIPEADCGLNIGQIQRIAFQRDGSPFTETEIITLAAWQGKTSAADATKIVVTPFIGANPIIEAGDAITNGGGDNSTLNGVEEVEGVNPSNFSADFKELSTSIEKAMKTLACEKNITVYFLLQGGKIAARKVSATVVKGFSAQSVFMSDRNNAGYGTKDTHSFRFSLPAGYSEELEIYTPTFNPLTDL
jgi:hypothetical protein